MKSLLKEYLTVSSNYKKLLTEYKELQIENEKLRNDIGRVESDNTHLKNEVDRLRNIVNERESENLKRATPIPFTVDETWNDVQDETSEIVDAPKKTRKKKNKEE